MPELPDITIYLEALEPRVVGQRVSQVQVYSPFLVRTYDPALESLEGCRVVGLERLGKRIVFQLDPADGEPEGDLFLVVHLMIAGRLHWSESRSKKKNDGKVRSRPRRSVQAELGFPSGTLTLSEAGKKKRASLHLVRGRAALAEHDPGGLDVFAIDSGAFSRQLRSGNHTLKRMLTDPRRFSGIGNAYSDEILHRARLSPVQLTRNLCEEEVDRLFEATKEVLSEWIVRLREQTASEFPKKVTAFRPGMAVHGRFREPCPDCGAPVQRIVYQSNETNYCAPCQTEGRLLADRALSRLLKGDWPRTLEEWTE